MCVFYIRGHFKGARWEATHWDDLQFSRDLGIASVGLSDEIRTSIANF